MTRVRRSALLVGILLLAVGCDQATKRLASDRLQSVPGHAYLGDSLRLQYAENRGAFLSLGATLPDGLRFLALTAGVAALLAGLVFYVVASRRLAPLQVVGCALIAGGGLGNWLDRLFRDGAVVDFLDLGVGSLRTGVFNLADVSIVAGVVACAAATWTRRRRAVRPAAR